MNPLAPIDGPFQHAAQHGYSRFWVSKGELFHRSNRLWPMLSAWATGEYDGERTLGSQASPAVKEFNRHNTTNEYAEVKRQRKLLPLLSS